MDPSLAFVEGQPAPKSATSSLWTLLHQRARIHADQPALLVPGQPASLLAELTHPWPHVPGQESPRGGLRTGSGETTSFLARATSPQYLLGRLLSLFVPAPAVDPDYLQWSFGELQRATLRLAFWLRQRGVKPGAAAVLLTPLCAEWALFLSQAALTRCTTAVFPSTIEAWGVELVQKRVNEIAPSLVVVSTEAEARLFHAKIKSDAVVHICLESFSGDAPPGWKSMSDVAKEAVSPSPDDRQEMLLASVEDEHDGGNRTAFIFYTSGSSSTPKGCILGADMFTQMVYTVCKPMPAFLPAPMVQLSGAASSSRCPGLLLITWASGNAVAIDAGEPSAASNVEVARTCRPIGFSTTVPGLHQISRATNFSAEGSKSVRFLHLISAVVTMATVRRAQSMFPKARVSPSFGMTEAAAVTSWAGAHPKSVDKMPSWRGIASSGKVAPGSALKIVDGNGAVLRRGELGALHLSGDSVMDSYVGNAKPEAFYTQNGRKWFVSEDDAVIDKDGYLFVVGRSEHTIMRESEAVIPSVVENFLDTEYPKSKAVVVKVTARSGEQGIFAIVDDGGDATRSIAQIPRLILDKFGPAYRVEGVASLNSLGYQEWPATPAGKVSLPQMRVAAEKNMVESEK
ncbi:hypothetical protein NLG97_g9752 [Lecanicillium saksenae]|uniref:Uncharacterized protein n=1 Tax=Lecanicillium saksenae TaxID=468837 RepID=A0ACC1QI52_9HYPO|nr:hypothetical protein NLG97_g9752 [Lecanicillium saksenae]